VEFKNAEHLVGMDTYETQAVIKRDESDDKLRIACIGIAGENLVKFACVINDEGRAAGRCGLGAVMGAKRLKAVGVHGTHEIRVANEREFTTVAREAFETVRESFIGTMFNQLGTSGYVDVGQIYGDMPNKYFQAGTSPGYDKLSGATMKETILIGRVHCYRCPIGCGRKIEIKKGKYKLPPTEGPEYETVAALGTLLNINDLSAVSYANWLCNRYGIDTISCGVTIAFAYWLYERNKLSTIFEESGGQKYREKLKLTWGNAEPMHELIELIARREGIGNLLADGAYMLGEKVGMSAYAAAVKRLEIPMHDPRAFIGQAVCYATAPRGACHLQGDMYQVDMAMAIPELDIHTTDRLVYTEAKIDNIIRIQNYRTLFNALCICQFAAVTPSQIALLLTHALGKQYEVRHLNEVGERIFTLKRMLNLQFGMRPQDDTLPQIVLESLREGGTEGKVPPLAQMLQDYYKHRKWDRNSGMPAKTKLRELNLEFTLNDSEST
jgi:aldehyde:ferredoxin oxidoreductase